MTTNSCIFCSILSQEISAPIIAHNDDVFVIKDINPKAPVHYLIMPKKHIHSLQEMEQSDAHLTASLFMMAQQLAATLPDKSCRLIMNNGKNSGQKVFHMHLHFLSGKTMTDF